MGWTSGGWRCSRSRCRTAGSATSSATRGRNWGPPTIDMGGGSPIVGREPTGEAGGGGEREAREMTEIVETTQKFYREHGAVAPGHVVQAAGVMDGLVAALA